MNDTKAIGTNRTGIAASPIHRMKLLEVPEMTVPSSEGEAADALAVREAYARKAEPMGSLPPPATGKQLVGMAVSALKGKASTLLLDKLGERLAFERSGTRLYDGILLKYDVFGSWDGGPSRGDLEHIREDELQHFLALKQAIESLGGDPTAVTPSANLHAVASHGIKAVIADPRSTLQECLEAIAIAELADNDCWENLVQLARAANLAQAEQFEEALKEEQEHLENVRAWLAAYLGTTPTRAMGTPRPIKAGAPRATRAAKTQRATPSRGAKTVRKAASSRKASSKPTGRARKNRR